MNKPAAKEPSMDEILSSIRQIIADDDAAAAPAPSRAAPMPASPFDAERAPAPIASMAAQAIPTSAPSEPLTLSPTQIVSRPEAAAVPPAPMQAPLPEPTRAEDIGLDPMLDMPQGEPALLDPEDVEFEAEMDSDPELAAAPPPMMRTTPVAPVRRPAAPVSRAAPMPDPTLSEDMAEQLLAPTTNAAVQGTMARLNAASMVNAGGQTIESLMREMMRPMLKEWLDENLPSLVERVVEREIVRITRGVK